MVTRAIVQHKSSRLKSLQTFYQLLPEFSEAPNKLNSVVDKAFHKSLVAGVTDVREWKPIRDEALKKQPNLTPRELARFKFALCNTGSHVSEAYIGRPALHDWLDTKALGLIPHMNAIELISLVTAYGSTCSAVFYKALISQLLQEIRTEESLDVLAVGTFAVNSCFNHDRRFIPVVKDPAHAQAVKDFSGIVNPKIVERVTEFTDDQFATICAGIGKVAIGFPNIEHMYEVTDALQGDFLARRAARMSLENLIDVAAGFFYTNLASDSLAKVIVDKIQEKKSQLTYFTAIDCIMAINARQPCPEDLVKHANTLIKASMVKEDYIPLTHYIFNTQCKDEDLIKAHLSCVMSNRPFPNYNYDPLKKHKFYLKKHFNHLLKDDFIELLEKSGFLYDSSRLLNNKEEFTNEHFERMEKWFMCLGLNYKPKHLHNSHEVIHFAIKPQNVAVQIALPKFHLIGKWEEDYRILREPKRKFKIANQFEYKCRWLELLGFKVVRVNYQELAENSESKDVRDQNFLQLLKPLGIKSSGETRGLRYDS